MALLTWSDEQSVGVGAMDEEHRRLFEAINALDAAMMENREAAVIGPLLRDVAERTRSHFASEESIMAYLHYPGFALHALKHQHLLDQLAAFVARFERGSMLNHHSLTFLRDWCNTHIAREDKQFGEWLNEHGKN